MAQIIDMEERRRPRLAQSGKAAPAQVPAMLDPLAVVDQLVGPMAGLWRSWIAAWGSVWLAPFGLQVSPIAPPSPLEPKDRIGPRR
jgi:hypothetical protein